jgi:hypothetical protein
LIVLQLEVGDKIQYMSKKRTKLQKIKAQYHYALPSTHSFSGIDAVSVRVPLRDVVSLYYYDPKLITMDIGRTMTVSIIILIIQMVIYLGWK